MAKVDGSARMLVSYEAASTAGSAKSAVARDAALGGLFIETKEPLPVGALLSVELKSPREAATLEARVFQIREREEGPDRPAGMAVRFLDLPDALLVKVQGILQFHRPPAHTRLGVGDENEALWSSAGGRDGTGAHVSDDDDSALLLAAQLQVDGRPTPDTPLAPPPPEEPRHPTPKMMPVVSSTARMPAVSASSASQAVAGAAAEPARSPAPPPASVGALRIGRAADGTSLAMPSSPPLSLTATPPVAPQPSGRGGLVIAIIVALLLLASAGAYLYLHAS